MVVSFGVGFLVQYYYWFWCRIKTTLTIRSQHMIIQLPMNLFKKKTWSVFPTISIGSLWFVVDDIVIIYSKTIGTHDSTCLLLKISHFVGYIHQLLLKKHQNSWCSQMSKCLLVCHGWTFRFGSMLLLRFKTCFDGKSPNKRFVGILKWSCTKLPKETQS